MISLITATGDRHEAMKLCARWMRQQTYRGDVEWIIVDDGHMTTAHVDMPRSWNIKTTKLPGQDTPAKSMAMNLLTGLSLSTGDPLFFIEDDDYYKPTYIEHVMDKMGDNDIIGQIELYYYNVAQQKYRPARCKGAALSMTACSRRLYHHLIEIVRLAYKEDRMDIDGRLWKLAYLSPDAKIKHYDDELLAVGIKGLPGRKGASLIHRSCRNFVQDTNYAMLKAWIGEDYQAYKDLMERVERRK